MKKFNLKIAKTKIDKKQLEMGIKVEMEHTDNPEIAKKIAIDHLKESPVYYSYLKKMEKEMPKTKDEKK
jgi:hypothetical protein